MTMLRQTYGGLLMVAMLLFATPLVAQQPLSSEDRAALQKVAAYLNDIKSLEASFLQLSSDGGTAEGTLLLSRPKRLRIEYKPPTPVIIVANSEFLSYVDTELEQVHHLPLEDTPAAFLLRDNFDFEADDLSVTAVERGSNTIRVSMVQAADPLAGQLTLVFTDNPVTLRKWTIQDAQGLITDLTLINPRFGFPIDEDRIDRLPQFDESND